MLKVLGAKLVLTEGAKGMKEAMGKAEELRASDPIALLHTPGNSIIRPIRASTFKPPGRRFGRTPKEPVDVLVSGVGTGGTITGVSRYIKHEKKHPLISIAVEPTASPVISQTLKKQELKPGSHKIQGLGAGFIPGNSRSVDGRSSGAGHNEESIEMARRLAMEEGLLSGISCGAAAAAAVRVAKEPEMAGKTIVVVLPDAGERYLSSALFEGMFD